MTSFVAFWALLWIVVVVALIAYRFGKRLGTRSGEQRMRAQIPLEMRTRSMEQGHCPICDRVGENRGTMWQKG